MPRRHPGMLLDSFSPRLRSDVQRLEASRNYLGPFAVEIALRAWTDFVHRPNRRIWDFDVEGCGERWCCTDPREAREILGAVACALPRKSARELRRRLQELDDLY
ncbi:hypothetical protein JNUCC0626_29325 [Lentzea sp. JNUCC 0626]|uniref:hypothetical protein n=1 Tax=Lentzea sp. JNUCC 0626 TaxID=3367513 RepID=UPI0037490547